MIRVALVEDVRSHRGGTATLLENEEDIRVVGRLPLDRTMPTLAGELRPDVVLINTNLMVSQLLPLITELEAAVRGCAVLILADARTPGMLPPRRHASGVSFLVKDADADLLARTIRQVGSGQRVVSPRLRVAALDVDRLVNTRELEILGLAAQGAPVTEISRRLFLSLGTVRNYLSAVIAKTGARNRIDAIRIVRDRGWLR